MKNLFTPGIDNNPFYKAAFDADFSQASNEKLLEQAFAERLNEINALIKETLEPLKSLTQTAEVFHYSALAAVLLQHKARIHLNEVLLEAPPEHSVETLIMEQFKVQDENKSDEIREQKNIRRYNKGKELSRLMSQQFQYTGSLMRALAMITAMSVCACRKNDMANAYVILSDYKPVNALLDESCGKRFPVIGSLYKAERSKFANSYSVRDEELIRVECEADNKFCFIFAEKVAELLSVAEMGIDDRARLEEMRDFYLDTLCRFFFNVRIINFPRILHLVSAVNRHTNENGCISEDELRKIAPAECSAFLGNEAILTKDSVDMSMTWYRVNGGIRNFAALTQKFNLLIGHKKTLLEEVVTN